MEPASISDLLMMKGQSLCVCYVPNQVSPPWKLFQSHNRGIESKPMASHLESSRLNQPYYLTKLCWNGPEFLTDSNMDWPSKLIVRQPLEDEYAALQSCLKLQRDSKILSLSPFMKDGIIRVGWRIDKGALPFDSRLQILLPRDHPLTNLLVSYFYSYRVAYFGLMTLNTIRTRYWPLVEL